MELRNDHKTCILYTPSCTTTDKLENLLSTCHMRLVHKDTVVVVKGVYKNSKAWFEEKWSVGIRIKDPLKSLEHGAPKISNLSFKNRYPNN